MLIKYKKPDPRAGMVCNLDEAAARKAIDDGRAAAHKEGSDSAPAPAPAPSPAPSPVTSASTRAAPAPPSAKRAVGRPRKE